MSRYILSSCKTVVIVIIQKSAKYKDTDLSNFILNKNLTFHKKRSPDLLS